MSTLGVCFFTPGQGEGRCILYNVKPASKITVVHNALKLSAVIPGKRVLLNMDDLFKLSNACLLHWPRPL